MIRTVLAGMRWLRLVAPIAALTVASTQSAAPVAAQDQSLPGGFSLEQSQGIEQLIRNYLIEHPEVIIESLTRHQQRQRVAEEEKRKRAIVEERERLANDPDSPVLGNPDGDVVIVEFFDYRCPYCRRVSEPVRKAVEEDGKVRLVMKEFPILGPQSVQASRAALAAVKQNKYEEFHFALMEEPGDMSDPHIRQIARTVGLDVEQLQKDMKSKDIDEMIRRNHELARTLGIGGTPAFVIGNTLVPGAIELAQIKQLIAQARNTRS